jgi:acyl-CoA thioesterase-2
VTAAVPHLPAAAPAGTSLLDLLELETLERDLFRATAVFDDPLPLYGGQVAAQALRAAGLTVPDERAPHSLHGYFLRGGEARRPTLLRVQRDRDGRSFSARRVEAVQDGEVIFTLSASFQVPEDGPDRQVDPAPDVVAPAALPPMAMPRLFSFEARQPAQPYPHARWPTRFWARCTEPLSDGPLPAGPLVQACALTYLSDILTGLVPLQDGGRWIGSSLDHAVWFHRQARLDEWVLIDLVPHTAAGGRGWYTGTITDRDGRLRASLTQETLFRRRPVQAAG